MVAATNAPNGMNKRRLDGALIAGFVPEALTGALALTATRTWSPP
jgi:hypothetical protein